jgi:hypothetical protein
VLVITSVGGNALDYALSGARVLAEAHPSSRSALGSGSTASRSYAQPRAAVRWGGDNAETGDRVYWRRRRNAHTPAARVKAATSVTIYQKSLWGSARGMPPTFLPKTPSDHVERQGEHRQHADPEVPANAADSAFLPYQRFGLKADIGEIRFPLRDGIPDFLDPADLEDPNGRYQHLYDRTAAFYDLSTWLYARVRRTGEEARRREYPSRLEVESGHRVLEVSVGTGANLPLLPGGASLFALDIS